MRVPSNGIWESIMLSSGGTWSVNPELYALSGDAQLLYRFLVIAGSKQKNQSLIWVVVGEPSRNYLWILSRTPAMNPDLYRQITQKLLQKGYDPEKLRRTVHQGGRS